MKKLIVTLIIISIFLLTGCVTKQSEVSVIGTEKAKTVAIENAGVSGSDISFTEASLKEFNGIEYYEVGFTANGEQYGYSIDALTGTVIQADVPQTTVEKVPEQQEVPAQTSPKAETPATETLIGEEKAKAAALAHAGLNADTVSFIKSGIDYDDGKKVYDVEFYTADGKEYDYDIDALSGEVLSFDFDAEYYTPPKAETEVRTELTETDARKLALSQVPGATDSDIREFEVDYDDGRLEYEGKIYYNSMEYEFEIDGYSGAIRNWEVESIYD